MLSSSDRCAKIWSVVRVSSGNFLEMYDFMVFGYYASAIGQAFFPAGNAFLSLMLSLMTFGAEFLMRPLGAIVLGAYTDKHGRRAGLLLTLGLMSMGIFSIACMPSDARRRCCGWFARRRSRDCWQWNSGSLASSAATTGQWWFS